jgi:hypothetical protein
MCYRATKGIIIKRIILFPNNHLNHFISVGHGKFKCYIGFWAGTATIKIVLIKSENKFGITGI